MFEEVGGVGTGPPGLVVGGCADGKLRVWPDVAVGGRADLLCFSPSSSRLNNLLRSFGCCSFQSAGSPEVLEGHGSSVNFMQIAMAEAGGGLAGILATGDASGGVGALGPCCWMMSGPALELECSNCALLSLLPPTTGLQLGSGGGGRLGRANAAAERCVCRAHRCRQLPVHQQALCLHSLARHDPALLRPPVGCPWLHAFQHTPKTQLYCRTGQRTQVYRGHTSSVRACAVDRNKCVGWRVESQAPQKPTAAQPPLLLPSPLPAPPLPFIPARTWLVVARTPPSAATTLQLPTWYGSLTATATTSTACISVGEGGGGFRG